MDTYQAIFDATRSRIQDGNVGAAVESAVRFAFDGASYLWPHFQQEIYRVSGEMTRPSVLFRPEVSIDGNQYSVLYGSDPMAGCAGFGDTLAEAMADFDKNWHGQKFSGSGLTADDDQFGVGA